MFYNVYLCHEPIPDLVGHTDHPVELYGVYPNYKEAHAEKNRLQELYPDSTIDVESCNSGTPQCAWDHPN